MADVFLELVRVVVPIVATALAGLAVWAVKDAKAMKRQSTEETKEARKSSNETVRIVKMAMVSLLRQKMVDTHRRALLLGKIHMADRANFFEMHATYVMLGGNGATSHLVDDIQNIPVVD